MQDRRERFLLVWTQRAGVEQVLVLSIEPGEHHRQAFPALGPRRLLDVLEGEEQDGIALEVGLGRQRSLDVQPREQRHEILGSLLDEAAQHRQVEGLAEAARSGQQQHLGVGLEHLGDQRGLVDIGVALLPQRAEVRLAQR